MRKILFIMLLIAVPFTFVGCVQDILGLLAELGVESASNGATTTTRIDSITNPDGTITQTITTTIIDADGNETTNVITNTYKPNDPNADTQDTGDTGSEDTLPITVNYNGNDYTCTDGTYTPIVDATSLQHIQSNLDNNYCLALDIDLSTITFEVIGNTEDSFTGILEGNNKRITGLNINEPNNDYIGIFAKIGSGGEVQNLTIENPFVKGKDYVGTLAGSNEGDVTNVQVEGDNESNMVEGEDYVGGLVGAHYGATITDCSNSGKIKATTSYIGGLVGHNSGGTIIDSYAEGDVEGSENEGYAIGGLVGLNHSNVYPLPVGRIVDSHASGNVNGNEGVGGLVGNNNNITERCYASGNVNGRTEIGGLVGYNGPKGITRYSYARGSSTGTEDSIGGFVGKNYGNNTNAIGRIENCYSTGNIERTLVGNTTDSIGGFAGTNKGDIIKSYSRGLVTAEGGYIGGFIGKQAEENAIYAITTNSYFDTTTTGQTNAIANNTSSLESTVTGITTEDIDNGGRNPFQSMGGWDFTDIWTAQGEGQWPTLAWQE